VMTRLGTKPREEYEPALPDIGSIVKAVRDSQHNRETRIRPEQLRPEVRKAIERVEECKRLEDRGELQRVPFELPENALAMDRMRK
jgi:hypothetical protein